jgi:hypothetical protein
VSLGIGGSASYCAIGGESTSGFFILYRSKQQIGDGLGSLVSLQLTLDTFMRERAKVITYSFVEGPDLSAICFSRKAVRF